MSKTNEQVLQSQSIDLNSGQTLQSQNQTQKLDDILNSHEKVIKSKKVELEKAIKEAAQSSAKKLKPLSKYDAQYVNDSDDEECTFKPRINEKSEKLSTKHKEKKGNGPIAQSLYKDAFERKNKGKENEKAQKEALEKMANLSKMSQNSLKMVIKKITRTIQSLLSDVESPDAKGKVSFENLGSLLFKMGVFQNIEFGKADDKSSLHLNSTKQKANLLSQEIAFHENLWKILSCASKEEDFVPSELLVDFMILLLEEKSSITSCASCLTEILERYINLKNGKPKNKKASENEAQEIEEQLQKDMGKSHFQALQEEKGLWKLEQIVQEFRKLFNDKTHFMNFYTNFDKSVLGGEKSLLNETLKSKSSEYSFRPSINDRSKLINSFTSDRGYIAKMMGEMENQDGEKVLKNRHNILYENFKFMKSKKVEEDAKIIQEEMKECTFKPKITKYNLKKNAVEGEEDPASKGKGLYTQSRSKKDKFETLKYQLHKQREDKEMSECTFNPMINHEYEYSAARDEDFYVGVPKGFRKAIERMQKAEEKRKEVNDAKNKVSRGENYEKLRNSEFKPPSFLNRQKEKKEEVLVYVEVNVTPGKVARIAIHRSDDPYQLAENFAKTYSLNPKAKANLATYLEQYIENYINNQNKQEEEEEQQLFDTQQAEDQPQSVEEEEEGEEEEEDDEDEDEEITPKKSKTQKKKKPQVEEEDDEDEDDEEEDDEEREDEDDEEEADDDEEEEDDDEEEGEEDDDEEEEEDEDEEEDDSPVNKRKAAKQVEDDEDDDDEEEDDDEEGEEEGDDDEEEEEEEDDDEEEEEEDDEEDEEEEEQPQATKK